MLKERLDLTLYMLYLWLGKLYRLCLMLGILS